MSKKQSKHEQPPENEQQFSEKTSQILPSAATHETSTEKIEKAVKILSGDWNFSKPEIFERAMAIFEKSEQSFCVSNNCIEIYAKFPGETKPRLVRKVQKNDLQNVSASAINAMHMAGNVGRVDGKRAFGKTGGSIDARSINKLYGNCDGIWKQMLANLKTDSKNVGYASGPQPVGEKKGFFRELLRALGETKSSQREQEVVCGI